MAAIYDLWIIRDQFISDNIDELYKLKSKAVINNKDIPYIFQAYNVKTFTPDSATGINRLLSAFITALNEVHHIPKLILVVPDGDLISAIPQQFTSSMIIGASLHYIIKQMDLALERRCQDLMNKRPGSIQNWKSNIIWACMLKRPLTQLDAGLEHIYMLHGKFNAILKERLLDGDAEHHKIISIDVPTNGFDLTGKLTGMGAAEYWSEINVRLKKFDYDKIKLRPRLQSTNKAQTINPQLKSQVVIPVTQSRKRKLPTPPPIRGVHHHHSSREGHSKARCRLDYENDGLHHRHNRGHHHRYSDAR